MELLRLLVKSLREGPELGLGQALCRAIGVFARGVIGASGMSHYHGYEGFLTFSKLRPIFSQARISSIQVAMQPPYGDRAKLALDVMFKMRG